jgi:small subunit ribosomal protein S18
MTQRMEYRSPSYGGDDDRDFGRTPDLNADAPGRRRTGRRRACRYCADRALVIDYKDPQALKYLISERGKVVPRRISGNCARHQRKVDAGDQARPQHRPPALHRDRVGRTTWLTTSTSSSRRTSTNVGKSGELVRVRPGFARNYLIPRGLAVSATRREQEPHRAREEGRRGEGREGPRLRRRSSRRSSASVKVTIARPGRRGRQALRLGHGTATSRRPFATVRASSSTSPQEACTSDALKSLGTHAVQIRLAPTVTATIQVEVAAKA